MADYRVVTRHVRYWRGQVHKWSCSYAFTGSGSTPDAAACNAFRTAESALLYLTTGDKSNGIWEVQIYHASGGTPVASVSYFDPDVPSAWIAPTGTAWGSHTALLEPVAEVAALIIWPAGLSATGKPVTFRHWYHAVPVVTAGGGASADIASGVQATLVTAAQGLGASLSTTYGLVMGNSRRLAGFTPVVEPFYSNHQMPRGRRRKPLVTASGRYTGPTVEVPEPIMAA